MLGPFEPSTYLKRTKTNLIKKRGDQVTTYRIEFHFGFRLSEFFVFVRFIADGFCVFERVTKAVGALYLLRFERYLKKKYYCLPFSFSYV